MESVPALELGLCEGGLYRWWVCMKGNQAYQ